MTKNPENPDRGLIRALNMVAWILGILGVVVTIVLLIWFGRGGTYAEARLEPVEVLTAVVAGFYHFLYAFLCCSISRVLKPETQKGLSRTIVWLKLLGWGAILIGAGGLFIAFPRSFGMGPRTWLHIAGALAFAVYNLSLCLACMGVAAVLKRIR